MWTQWGFPVDNAHFLLRGNATERNDWGRSVQVHASTNKKEHKSTPNSQFSHHSQMPPWLLHNYRFPPCIPAGCSLVSSPPRRSLLSGASAAPSVRHLLAGTLEIQTISVQHRNKEGGLTKSFLWNASSSLAQEAWKRVAHCFSPLRVGEIKQMLYSEP